VIEQLLPAAACGVEAFADRLDIELFPEEADALRHAAAKRRHEFISARACARDALARLGVPAAPLLPGERGAPSWPDGVVGSMTHCEGYRAAAVARPTDLASVGIDAEPDAPLPEGVFDLVTVPDDLPGIAVVSGCGIAGDRLLFSAKESVYKAWFPLARRWLGFNEATVALHANGTFTARLLVDGAIDGGRTLTSFDGRWLAARGLVATAAIVPPA